MAYQSTPGFIYGNPPTLPKLPEGWEIISSKEDFLKARCPQGKLHVIRTDGALIQLYPRP